MQHADSRVLIFTVPARPLGLHIQFERIYWARAGDTLRPMATQELQRAFDEAGPDLSAELHPSATLDDLDPALIDQFRAMWRKKSGTEGLDRLGDSVEGGDSVRVATNSIRNL